MPDNTSHGLMMFCKTVFHFEEGGRVGKGRDINGGDGGFSSVVSALIPRLF